MKCAELYFLYLVSWRQQYEILAFEWTAMIWLLKVFDIITYNIFRAYLDGVYGSEDNFVSWNCYWEKLAGELELGLVVKYHSSAIPSGDWFIVFILTRGEDAVTCGIPLSSVCTPPQGCSRGEPAVGEAWTGGGWEPGPRLRPPPQPWSNIRSNTIFKY